MKFRKSFAEAGLAPFFVTPMPRETIGVASVEYVQSRICEYCELLLIVKRAVGEVRNAATAPPCASSWSWAPTPVYGLRRLPIFSRFAQPFFCT